ncbi:glycoside hydrolase family 32 protein [Maribellus maritimus]|uniref:glycoside hydrolase family 32 protein n=1 Tax=Maribellus maritimus TaxID=2870838 RepID=UPI001EEA3A27|nr:glycoside hydrolase family 32 protein [Maribellus maritimus]MCG6191289.1 glycoside hydrolase family 32 protein [Maribellus maritimus]
MRLFSIIILFAVLSACNHQVVENRFNEKHRPQFHFSPPSQWTNDPNGMVYLDGEYHLFYQHYPDSNVWGPMHWGHAISTDLIHWEHLPIAIYPDSLGWIFSGSAVIDHNNTSGLGSEKNPPMVAIYTYHNHVMHDAGQNGFQYQGIAYSLDKGRTWAKYEKNPVLPNPGLWDFRDPKVVWHEASQRWIMALAITDHVGIYSSKDLLSWEYESDFGEGAGSHNGVWECPDLFPLTDDEGNEIWGLLVSVNAGGPNGGSATQYFLGEFDGETYTSFDTLTRWIDYGCDNYAGVTYSDIPAEDGRRIFIGWMSNWDYANQVPTEVWRNAMTLPRTLTLTKNENGYIFHNKPVDELKKSEAYAQSIEAEEAIELNDSLYHIQLEIELEEEGFLLELSNASNENVTFELNDTLFLFDRTNSGITDFSEKFDKLHTAPYSKNSENVKMDIYVDLSSIEVFINDGELVLTDLVFPTTPYQKVSIIKGQKHLKKGDVYSIQTIW